MQLDGKVAIVTGASGGIGEAITRMLRAEGARLVITARSAEKLAALSDELGETAWLAGEVTDETLPDRLLMLARQRFGRADILVNNAGVMTVGSVEETDIAAVCAMVRINFEALVRFAYTFLKPMKAAGSGFVLNISSVAGTMVPPMGGVYAGTKHAVEAFTEGLWNELVGSGVGVAALEPGTVATGLYKDWANDKRDWVNSLGALTAGDIADCARFILTQPEHMRVVRMLALPAGRSAA